MQSLPLTKIRLTETCRMRNGIPSNTHDATDPSESISPPDTYHSLLNEQQRIRPYNLRNREA